MSMDILKEDIKNNKIRSLYLFYGNEDYLKKYYLDSIEKSILNDATIQLNKVVLEGKTETKKIIEAAETMPAFSDRKMVIVKNTGMLKPKKKASEEGKSKVTEDEMTKYLQKVPEYTCLIFCEEEIDKRVKAVDVIKKNGLLVDFPYQKPAELIKWVVKVFKSYGKDIGQYTAARFIDNCEQGMNEILNEINKLVLYLDGKNKVSDEDIDKVCTKSVKSRIFDLTDAIGEKNADKALKILNDMVLLKEPLPKILFMMTRQFRQILEMKLLIKNGTGANEAASKMSLSPYAAGKIVKQSSNFSIDILKEAIKDSLEVDVAIKSGKLNDRVAAEILISKFSRS